MTNNRIKRTEKKPLPPVEGEKKTQVIVGNLDLLQVQLLSDISGKLDKLLAQRENRG